jgi:hypothetical protein
VFSHSLGRKQTCAPQRLALEVQKTAASVKLTLQREQLALHAILAICDVSFLAR